MVHVAISLLNSCPSLGWPSLLRFLLFLCCLPLSFVLFCALMPPTWRRVCVTPGCTCLPWPCLCLDFLLTLVAVMLSFFQVLAQESTPTFMPLIFLSMQQGGSGHSGRHCPTKTFPVCREIVRGRSNYVPACLSDVIRNRTLKRSCCFILPVGTPPTLPTVL